MTPHRPSRAKRAARPKAKQKAQPKAQPQARVKPAAKPEATPETKPETGAEAGPPAGPALDPRLDSPSGPILSASSISLAELQESAELLDRFDRAYLVPVPIFTALATHLTDPDRPEGPYRALEIGGRRWFRYHSVYYDTPDLRCFHEHRQGRRVRFKIRERVYQDSGERQFEIKLRGGRGETIKHRRRLTGDDTPLDTPYRDFLAESLRTTYGIDAPPVLDPSVVTDYKRATLVSAGERITCDAVLRCHDVRVDAVVDSDPGLILVETKTIGHLTEADRFLHAQGVRPAVFTKYCSSLASLQPSLPANIWRRHARFTFGRA
ncbi:VTC domain-containing protein [Streptomyces sp. NPDC055078]